MDKVDTQWKMTSLINIFIFCIFVQFHCILGLATVGTTILGNSTLKTQPFTPSTTLATTISSRQTLNLTIGTTTTATDQTLWPPSTIDLNTTMNESKDLFEEESDYNSTEWPMSTIEDIEWTLDFTDNRSTHLGNDSLTMTTDESPTTSPSVEQNVTIESKGLNSLIKGLNFDFNQMKETTGQAIGHGLDDIQEKIKSTVQNKFDEVTNFASVSLEQIQSYPLHVWDSAKEEVLKTLNSNQSASVLDKLKAVGDVETWTKLVNILKNKLDTGYIIEMINNKSFAKNPDLDKKLVETVGDRLGDPEEWNETVVDTIGPSIMQLHPSILMQIKNKAAMSKVFYHMLEYLNSTNDRPEVISQSLSVLSLRLSENKFGPIGEWNYVNCTLASIVPIIQPLNIKRLKSSTVKNSMKTIGSMEFHDRGHAQPVIEAILRDVNFTALTKERAGELIKSLGKSVRHLRVQDISSTPRYALDNTIIKDICAHSNNEIDKELGKWLLSISKPREDDWTKEDVANLQPLLGFASSHVLSELASKNLLDGPTITAIFQNQYLDKPQLRAVENATIKAFKIGGRWDLDSASANLLPIISSEDLKQMKNEDIVKHMDKFNKVVKYMSPAQTVEIAQKIQEMGPNQLSKMEVKPHSSYLSLLTLKVTDEEDDVKKILMNMPIDSPQVQNYVNKKWDRVANNVTIDVFRDDIIMLKCLTCEMLDLLEDEHSLELLEIVSDTNCPLQIKTTICIAEKLKRHLKKNTKQSIFNSLEDIDEEIQLLSTLTFGQLSVIGGQLLVYFSAMSLQEQLPRSRCQFIFALIGQVSLKTLNLLQPPEKKRQMARAALNCMDKSEKPLKAMDAYVIGNLAGYMPETVLANMETSALIVSLPHINGISPSINELSCWDQQTTDHRPPPCLTTAVRNTLRHKLSNAFGPPSKWGETELRSIGCLLSVLYPDQLNQISDTAILSVSDELIKCWDQSTTSDVYTTLCQKELPLSSTMMTAESNRQLKRRLAEAALNRVDIKPRIKRSSNTLKVLSCDVVTKLGPAVVEVTAQELEPHITDCLTELGRYPISNEKATVLWDQLKKVLGKTAANVDVSTYESMVYIAQGLNVTELSTLTLKTRTQIAAFGTPHRNFSTAQLSQLAKRVLQDYQPNPANWTADDMITFGYILCGFQTTDIDQILPEVYFLRSRLLKEVISSCPIEIRQAFAQKALNFYGPVSNWTSDIITTIGPALGGLPPDQLEKVPGLSFKAVTPDWVKTIPLESIKVLHGEQLGNLSLEAISNLSRDQLDQLSPTEREMIDQIKGIPSGAQSDWPMRILMIYSLLLTLMYI